MNCKNCNNKLTRGDDFCNRCGQPTAFSLSNSYADPVIVVKPMWYTQRKWIYTWLVCFFPVGWLMALQSPKLEWPEKLAISVGTFSVVFLVYWLVPFESLYQEYRNRPFMIKDGFVICTKDKAFHEQVKMKKSGSTELAFGCREPRYGQRVKIAYRDFTKVKVEDIYTGDVYLVEAEALVRAED